MTRDAEQRAGREFTGEEGNIVETDCRASYLRSEQEGSVGRDGAVVDDWLPAARRIGEPGTDGDAGGCRRGWTARGRREETVKEQEWGGQISYYMEQ
jgi:hypothetical protein